MLWAKIGLAAALSLALTLISSTGWAALLLNAGAAAAAAHLFFDVALLGAFVLSILLAVFSAFIVVAILLGIWGDVKNSLRRLGRAAAVAAACVSPIFGAWAYAMVQVEALSFFWATAAFLVVLFCAAALAVAGQVFTLCIVRALILPSTLPPKLFQFLSGCPEDHLDRMRQRMTSKGWEPLAVTAEAGSVAIDSMVWRGGSQAAKRGHAPNGRVLPGGPERWAILFLGNGARYEDCGMELEQYGRDLGVSVCGFNYRGVGRSTGVPWRFEDLVADGEAVLQCLCERYKVTPGSVILHGHSMGGAAGG